MSELKIMEFWKFDEADLGALPDGGPVSFGQDAAGELYVLFQSGQISRITAA